MTNLKTVENNFIEIHETAVTRVTWVGLVVKGSTGKTLLGCITLIRCRCIFYSGYVQVEKCHQTYYIEALSEIQWATALHLVAFNKVALAFIILYIHSPCVEKSKKRNRIFFLIN